MAETYGIGLLVWSPLAMGFLTGRYRRSEPAPTDSRFHIFSQDWWKEHHIDVAYDVVEEVEKLSAEKGCTPTQLNLAWCMQQPGVTSVIIGPRTSEQLKDCLGALDVSIIEKELKRLDEIAPPGRMTVPYYKNDGWRPHHFQW